MIGFGLSWSISKSSQFAQAHQAHQAHLRLLVEMRLYSLGALGNSQYGACVTEYLT